MSESLVVTLTGPYGDGGSRVSRLPLIRAMNDFPGSPRPARIPSPAIREP